MKVVDIHEITVGETHFYLSVESKGFEHNFAKMVERSI